MIPVDEGLQLRIAASVAAGKERIPRDAKGHGKYDSKELAEAPGIKVAVTSKKWERFFRNMGYKVIVADDLSPQGILIKIQQLVDKHGRIKHLWLDGHGNKHALRIKCKVAGRTAWMYFEGDKVVIENELRIREDRPPTVQMSWKEFLESCNKQLRIPGPKALTKKVDPRTWMTQGRKANGELKGSGIVLLSGCKSGRNAATMRAIQDVFGGPCVQGFTCSLVTFRGPCYLKNVLVKEKQEPPPPQYKAAEFNKWVKENGGFRLLGSTAGRDAERYGACGARTRGDRDPWSTNHAVDRNGTRHSHVVELGATK